ncbi:MAG: hypothetical protein GXO66_06130 [Euryarchaeota archaeon]|nr:hypothetical protein [Euryarchaeota archaeon]
MSVRKGLGDIIKVFLIGVGAILWAFLSLFICFECPFLDPDYGISPPLGNLLFLLDMVVAAAIVFLLLKFAFRLIDKILAL